MGKIRGKPGPLEARDDRRYDPKTSPHLLSAHEVIHAKPLRLSAESEFKSEVGIPIGVKTFEGVGWTMLHQQFSKKITLQSNFVQVLQLSMHSQNRRIARHNMQVRSFGFDGNCQPISKLCVEFAHLKW